MKKIVKLFALSVMALAAVAACEKPEPQTPEKPEVKEATAIELDARTIECKAEKPAETTIQVTADGTWTAKSEAEWIVVDPTSGKGNLKVKVTVQENVAEQTTEARSGKVIFTGAKDVKAELVVNQEGKTVEPEVKPATVINITDKQDKLVFAAVAEPVELNIEADGTWTMELDELVEATPAQGEGNAKVSIKVKDNIGDKTTLAREGTFKFIGGEGVVVEQKFGQEGKAVVILPELPEGIWFQDDFEWLKFYQDALVANEQTPGGDAVANADSKASAPNLMSLSLFQGTFLSEFHARGYDDYVGSENSIYLQTYYLKFGRGKVINGIKLMKPFPEAYQGQPVNIEFDWCAHGGGSGTIDAVKLVVEIDGEGQFENGNKLTDPIAHSQLKSEYKWQHVNVKATGLNANSKIYIRPENVGATSGYFRWHLDNIRISTPVVE